MKPCSRKLKQQDKDDDQDQNRKKLLLLDNTDDHDTDHHQNDHKQDNAKKHVSFVAFGQISDKIYDQHDRGNDHGENEQVFHNVSTPFVSDNKFSFFDCT